MANFNIVSARVPISVYNGLKAILDTQNITVSEFIKSAVDSVSSLQFKAVNNNISKKTEKGFLVILAVTGLTILGVYTLVKIKESNITKTIKK